MTLSFEKDRFPGKSRILFIGFGNSSHTHSWIDLLEKAEINVRLFSMPGTQPPNNWPVLTYVSQLKGDENLTRRFLYHETNTLLKIFLSNIKSKFGYHPLTSEEWLAQIIREWKPDVIHTLGLFDNQGGEFFLKIREQFNLQSIGKWVLQLRGGSDLALRHNMPECKPVIQQALENCDYIICDNYKNIQYSEEFGIPRSKFAPFVPVPGTGGIDFSESNDSAVIPPSKRERIILWPKAYDCKWSLALPVLEAIRNCWEKIAPCEIYLLAITPDTNEWFMTLPEEIRNHCHVHTRIPRSEVVALMKQARILLAPSLVEGVPNSLYEAMTYGAFPIVSPLETIIPIVKNEANVLFARNLYPDEIGAAIMTAMNDDSLIDKAANENYCLATKLANRKLIGHKVVDFYDSISRFNN